MTSDEPILFDRPSEGVDPLRAARAGSTAPLPKRFYETVAVMPGPHGFALELDGRPARTPGRKPLALATVKAAEQVAEEWRAQGEHIDPARMFATKIANSGIDHVPVRRDEVVMDAAKYAESDLLFYHASEPDTLVGRQRRIWNPLVALSERRLSARFRVTEGIGFVKQDVEALEAVCNEFACIIDPVALAATHVMTTLSGSALLALAVWHGEVGDDEAFAASELEADWTLEIWGEDEEALQRRAFRAAEFRAAARLAVALRP